MIHEKNKIIYMKNVKYALRQVFDLKHLINLTSIRELGSTKADWNFHLKLWGC